MKENKGLSLTSKGCVGVKWSIVFRVLMRLSNILRCYNNCRLTITDNSVHIVILNKYFPWTEWSFSYSCLWTWCSLFLYCSPSSLSFNIVNLYSSFKTHLFRHYLFRKVLYAFYMPGTVLATVEMVVNKTFKTNPASWSLPSNGGYELQSK